MVFKDPHAILHDFCMSIPFGGFAVAAGLGCCCLSQGSTGVPILSMGALIVLSSIMSLKAWKKRSASLPFTMASAGEGIDQRLGCLGFLYILRGLGSITGNDKCLI